MAVRPRLWFDGAPDRVTRLRNLLEKEPLPPPRVVHAKADRRVVLREDAQGRSLVRRWLRSA